MSKFELEYRRSGTTFDGRILYNKNLRVTFSGRSFRSMLLELSVALKEDIGADVTLQRTDRPGLQPMDLSEEEIIQLREDPESVIKALSPPDRVITIKDTASPTATAKARIRAGVSTLADAFGDRLYVRLRQGKLESPFTGRWVEPKAAEIDYVEHNNSWASVSTKDLLSYNQERYFLPRLWNVQGPWIGKELLKAKYEEYLKEKSNA